jgi:hypothetical protein
MDPNELIKAAPEIAKGAGALAAAIPFTAIVSLSKRAVRLWRCDSEMLKEPFA